MKKIIIGLLTIFLLLSGCKRGQNGSVDKNLKLDENATYIDNIKDDPGPLTLMDYAPKDMMPIEMTDSSIWVSFSKPMVPLSKLGKVITDSMFDITPPINGVFRWYGSRILSFEPKENLIPAQEYKVIIKDNCVSLSGAKFEGNRTFSFYTETLKIMNNFPQGGNVSPEESRTIVITFNMNFDPNEVVKYIEVKVDNRNVGFDIEIPTKAKYKDYDESLLKKMLVLRVKEKIEFDKDVIVTLKKGAKPRANGYGTKEDITFQYHTTVPFNLVSFYNSPYEYGMVDFRYATFVFSQPVDPKEIEKYLFISIPAISDIKKYVTIDTPLESQNDDYDSYQDDYYDYYYGWDSSYGKSIRISMLPVEYNSSYTITIKKGLKDIYGQELKETIFKEIEVGDAESFYTIKDTGNKILESDYNSKYYIETQNIYDGYYKIKSSSDPFYIFQLNELEKVDFSSVPKNTFHYEVYDLRKYLNENGKGIVNMAWSLGESRDQPYNLQTLNLQVTNLGVSLRYGYNKFSVLVGQLNDGKPVEGATVNIKNKNGTIVSGITDKSGLAVIDFSQYDWKEKFIDFKNYEDRFTLIEVIKDDDKLIYKLNPYSHNLWSFNIYNTVNPENVKEEKKAVFIFTDRGLYKPGETVTYKGVDRNIILGKFEPYQGKSSINVMDNAYGENLIYSEKIENSKLGSFNGNFKLPDDIQPGHYSIFYYRDDSPLKKSQYQGSVSFQVAHFRRLNFSVKTTVAPILWFVGDTITANIKSEYLSGGALKGGEVESYWERRTYGFYPKDDKLKYFRYGPGSYDSWTSLSSDSGVISGDGSFTSKQKTEKGVDGQPYIYEVVSNVSDIDRQVVSSRGTAVVHPAEYYIGAKIGGGTDDWWSTFVSKNKDFNIDLVTILPDETIHNKTEKITCQLIYEDWKLIKQKGIGGRIQTRYQKNEVVEKELSVSTSKGRANIKLGTEKSGSYTILLKSFDQKRRAVVTKLNIYSTGSDWVLWNSYGTNDIEIVLDKSIYKPGETANLLVKSPLKEGNYLLTIEREGILEEKVIEMKGNANLIPVNITDKHIPLVYVSLTSYSGRSEQPPTSKDVPDVGKPKGYFGIVKIPVDFDSRCIKLTFEKDKTNYRPKDKVNIKIKATVNNKPVEGAEITYLAADRGVLDLINYHIPNPVEYFYSEYHFPLGVRGGDSRELLIDPVTYELEDLPGGDGDDSKQDVRKDFRATAIFEPSLITDSNGEVSFSFTLPDSLTTFRDTAFVVTKDMFGLNEDEIKVSNPINVRTALPRKLRINDRTKAGVIVTNLSGKVQTVEVTVESDLLKIINQNNKIETIANGESMEICFELETYISGSSNIKFAIKSEILNEILEDKIVIEEPIVYEAFTIIGKTEDKITEGVNIPRGVKNKEGGISIALDSTRFASLKESFGYLNNYPYECLEQKVSRVFPLVMFGEASQNFGFKGAYKDYKKSISELLKELSKYQKSNGGFSYWSDNWSYSNYYLSLRVYHLLIEAKNNGYYIPKDIDYNLLKTFIKTEYINGKYVSHFSKVYACYVLSLDNENVKTRLQELEKYINYLPISGRALMSLAYNNNKNNWEAKSIFNGLSNYIRVGTQTLDITQPKESINDIYFWDENTDMALLLMLYSEFKPESQFVENIVNTIFQRQKAGIWKNTHSTGWILYAFGKVFKKESGKQTDFKGVVSLGGNEIINQEFKGINNQLYLYNLGIEELQKISSEKTLPLSFAKEGNGTLFYTATIKYALNYENITARDEGISIYSEITDFSGNSYDKNLKLGVNYKYRVYVSSSRDREFLAVRIPLPSGAEPINGSFVTSVSSGSTNNNYENNYYEWFSPSPVQKIYDNEVVYYIDSFRMGNTKLEFQFRTTTPGLYPTPPIIAEMMYEPEVFGRSDGKLFEIK